MIIITFSHLLIPLFIFILWVSIYKNSSSINIFRIKTTSIVLAIVYLIGAFAYLDTSWYTTLNITDSSVSDRVDIGFGFFTMFLLSTVISGAWYNDFIRDRSKR